MITDHKKKKQKFSDDIFVPSISSLCNNPKQVKSLYKDFNQWVRIPELYKGQQHHVFHSIDPNDIKQGELGNCYFLSALSSLAEKSERIERLFEDQDINDQGCYYVRLCVDGIWRFILVDDFTPCSLNNRPVFAQPRTEEGVRRLLGFMQEFLRSWSFGSSCWRRPGPRSSGLTRTSTRAFPKMFSSPAQVFHCFSPQILTNTVGIQKVLPRRRSRPKTRTPGPVLKQPTRRISS